MFQAESPRSRQQEGARQRQSQQQWGKARLASLHKHCSSAEQRESKTVKCLKLELPNPSWGSLERSPGPGALGEQHKRQRRGREGSLGTAASRARRSGSQERLAVPLPAPSHPASRTRQTSPCTHRDRQTPHTAPSRGSGDLLSLRGWVFGDASVLGQRGEGTRCPGNGSVPLSGLQLTSCPRRHTGPTPGPCCAPCHKPL